MSDDMRFLREVVSDQAPNSPWTFDEEVASRFDAEARLHIPDYERVIDRCVRIALSAYPDKQARILDVGSALGYTVQRMKAAGFEDIYGVEKSEAMIARSAMPERVIHSDVFPDAAGPFDVVLANWTLHFIADRRQYLKSIYDGLSQNGVFVMSEKMAASQFVHDRYHDFKRSNNVSEEEIGRKHLSLRRVLTPLSLEWYLSTFKDIGFKDVSVVDASWCFATLIAFK